MKKLYFLILFAIPFCSLAQPTITQTDEPILNLIVGTAIDNGFTGPVPSSGANQTWNYSSLQWVDTGGAHFIAVEGTPYQANFPNANLAVNDPVKNEWIYFRTAASGFYIDGLDSAGINFSFNPSWMYLPVPFTYPDSRTNRGRAQIDSTVDFGFGPTPARLIHTVDDYFTSEGYGTLMIPGNTFSNTLLIKDRQVTTDTVLADFGFGYMLVPGVPPTTSQAHTYRWVRHNGPDAFLLEIRADSLGTTAYRSEYQLISTISVPEIQKQAVRVNTYPNPTAGEIHIDLGAEKNISGTINIYNTMGELVRATSFADVSALSINVNRFSSGLYHFSIISSDDKTREGSFTVSHR
jgi:hypothetical protein